MRVVLALCVVLVALHGVAAVQPLRFRSLARVSVECHFGTQVQPDKHHDDQDGAKRCGDGEQCCMKKRADTESAEESYCLSPFQRFKRNPRRTCGSGDLAGFTVEAALSGVGHDHNPDRQCDAGPHKCAVEKVCCEAEDKSKSKCESYLRPRPALSCSGEFPNRFAAGDIAPHVWPTWLWEKVDPLVMGASAGRSQLGYYWTLGTLLEDTAHPAHKYILTNEHNVDDEDPPQSVVTTKAVVQPSPNSMDKRADSRRIGEVDWFKYNPGHNWDAAIIKVDGDVATSCEVFVKGGAKARIKGAVALDTVKADDVLYLAGRMGGWVAVPVKSVADGVIELNTDAVVLAHSENPSVMYKGNSGSVAYKYDSVAGTAKVVGLFDGSQMIKPIADILTQYHTDKGVQLRVCSAPDEVVEEHEEDHGAKKK